MSGTRDEAAELAAVDQLIERASLRFDLERFTPPYSKESFVVRQVGGKVGLRFFLKNDLAGDVELYGDGAPTEAARKVLVDAGAPTTVHPNLQATILLGQLDLYDRLAEALFDSQ